MSHTQDAAGPEGRRKREARLVAGFRPSRWPGLIWAVPLAALVFVGSLAIHALMTQGPHATVQFQTTGGIEAGQTNVTYRGVTVGHVTAVHLSGSLREMTVSLAFGHAMVGHLGRGTRFWIGGERPSVTDLSSLKALISGPYIGVAPVAGPAVTHFVGLEQPPVLKLEAKGETFTLTAGDPGNVSPGAPVFFRHYQVGEVQGLKFVPATRRFEVFVFIHRQYVNLVDARTRFWSAGAVHVALGANGPGVMLESVPALFTGAIAFETPAGGPGVKSGAAATFRLYPSRAAAEQAPGPHAVAYRVELQGGPHGLETGAGVTLEGASVGVVTAVHALYDPGAGAMRTVVDIALDPEQIARPAGKAWDLGKPAPQMNAMLATLIGHGLRAELASSTPLIGSKEIALDLVPNAAPATLEAGAPPTIPAIGATGTGAIIARLSEILAKLNALPLPEIAQNIRSATADLAALGNSAATQQTLGRLDATIQHLDQLTRETATTWPAVLAEIRASTYEADRALAATRALLSSEGEAANAPESTTLPRALYELTRAAESLRALASYLAGHPNAVIFGRRR